MRRPVPAASRRDRFEALAMPHLAVLHRVATRLTRDLADTADLVQETYLRAYRTFDNFAAGTNERAWLSTILRSIAVNRRRAQRRQPQLVSLQTSEEDSEREIEIPDERGLDELQNRPRLAWEGSAAARALAALPEPFRSAVQMVDLDELSYEEAAAAAGCATGTLRSRLFRGRRRLAAALGGAVGASGAAGREVS